MAMEGADSQYDGSAEDQQEQQPSSPKKSPPPLPGFVIYVAVKRSMFSI